MPAPAPAPTVTTTASCYQAFPQLVPPPLLCQSGLWMSLDGLPAYPEGTVPLSAPSVTCLVLFSVIRGVTVSTPPQAPPGTVPSRTELSNSHLWTQWPATARCPLPAFLVTAAPACSLHGVGACWAGVRAHILQCRRHCVLLIPFLLSTCQGQTLLGPGQVLCVGHRQQSSNFKGRRVPSARKERKGVLLWADFVPVDITQPEAAGIVTDFPSSF